MCSGEGGLLALFPHDDGVGLLYKSNAVIESSQQGHLGGSVVEHLPLAQVMVLGSWDQVPHWLLEWSLLLPLPMGLEHRTLGP